MRWKQLMKSVDLVQITRNCYITMENDSVVWKKCIDETYLGVWSEATYYQFSSYIFVHLYEIGQSYFGSHRWLSIQYMNRKHSVLTISVWSDEEGAVCQCTADSHGSSFFVKGLQYCLREVEVRAHIFHSLSTRSSRVLTVIPVN